MQGRSASPVEVTAVPLRSLWRREYATEGGRLDWHHPERNGTKPPKGWTKSRTFTPYLQVGTIGLITLEIISTCRT